MTIGWAIVIVAILYLLDKYGRLKKTLKVSSIVAVIAAFVFAVVISVGYISDRWKDHKFAKAHGCFNPSTGKVNPVNGSYPWCSDEEQLQERATFDTSPVATSPASQRANANGWEPVPPPAGYTAGDVVSDPSTPPPPGFVPLVTGYEFTFRRIGSEDYLKAICYDEATGKATRQGPFADNKRFCKSGSIMMEEVK